jgi:hypothetical protein
MADDNKPHINMAAAAARYGPLAPHMLSEIPKRRVGSIGYDSPIKQICILPARHRYKSQKHSDGEERFMSSLPHHRSILWALYRLVAGKMHIRLLGASAPINPTQWTGIFDNICGARGPFSAAASMVVVLVVFLRQVGKSTKSSVRGRPKYLDE